MEEAMQLALSIQPTFQVMSCSTTARHLPYCALELPHAETTISATQLEAHLQAALVEQFLENQCIVEQSTCQQLGAHQNDPIDSSPNADAEADFIPTFRNSMRIIPCPKVNVMDIEHTHTHNVLCLSIEYYVKRVLM
jgi:hypothetical protein